MKGAWASKKVENPRRQRNSGVFTTSGGASELLHSHS